MFQCDIFDLFGFTIDREGAFAALLDMGSALGALAGTVVFANLIEAIGIGEGETGIAGAHIDGLKRQHVMEEGFLNLPGHTAALGCGSVVSENLAGVVKNQEPRATDGRSWDSKASHSDQHGEGKMVLSRRRTNGAIINNVAGHQALGLASGQWTRFRRNSKHQTTKQVNKREKLHNVLY